MIHRSLVLFFLILEACSSSGSSSGDDTDGGTSSGQFPSDAGGPQQEEAPDGAPPGCVFRGLGPLQAKTAASTGDGAPWTTPEGAIVKDDGAVATVVMDGQDSAELVLGDYGFDVPANAKVIGFELQFNRQAEGDVLDAEIHVVANGTPSPTKKFFGPLWPKSAQGEHIYGDEADDWGFARALEGSAINAKSFGVSIKVKRSDGMTKATAKVDQARMSVLFCL